MSSPDKPLCFSTNHRHCFRPCRHRTARCRLLRGTRTADQQRRRVLVERRPGLALPRHEVIAEIQLDRVLVAGQQFVHPTAFRPRLSVKYRKDYRHTYTVIILFIGTSGRRTGTRTADEARGLQRRRAVSGMCLPDLVYRTRLRPISDSASKSSTGIDYNACRSRIRSYIPLSSLTYCYRWDIMIL